MPRVLPRHVEKQWGIGGVCPAMPKSIKKEPLGYPKSIILQNGHPVLEISGFDEISGLAYFLLWSPLQKGRWIS